MKKELGLFVMLIVLCACAQGFDPDRIFLTSTNIQNLCRLIGMFGIFSIGLGIVIITGGIDLSAGSMFALLGVILAGMLVDAQWFWPLAIIGILAVGMLIGGFHGFLVTRVKMQPFIVTLCGLLLYRGLARYLAGDVTKGFGTAEGFETLQRLATMNVGWVPMSFLVLIVIAVIMWLVLHRSVYGRYLFAVGRNEEAARFSGVNTRLVMASAYVLAGLLTGVSAILFSFYTNSVSPSSHGNFYELYGIAAAVLGGCSLRGGEGTVLGIIIGTALLQVLQNVVNLLGIDSSLNFAVMGAVILIGVVVDILVKDWHSKRRVAMPTE